MSANLVIIQLLHTQSDHADFLRMCWDKLSELQKKQIFYFLYNANQHKTFLTILRHEINTESPYIPWTHLLSILIQIKKLDLQKIKSLINIESDHKELGTFRLDIPEIAELWQKRKSKIYQEYLGQKEKLMKDLDFARNQGLKDKRIQILKQLKQLFPDDKDVSLAFHSEKEFHARIAFNRVATKKTNQKRWSTDSLQFSKEEKKQILKVAKKYIKKDLQYSKDFSVFLSQMEQYELALQIIDIVKSKPTDILWIELKICLDAHQFARALSLISTLQSQTHNTDHSFSLLYYQALALYGLGHASDAVQIIKKILKIRPNYKSANSLLLEWESDL